MKQFINNITVNICNWLGVSKKKFTNTERNFIFIYPIIAAVIILIFNLIKWFSILEPNGTLTSDVKQLIAIASASFTIFEIFGCSLTVIILWAWAYIAITKCPEKQDYETKQFNLELYAKYQSEKTEYTLIGGGLSLGSLIKSAIVSEYQLDFLLIGIYALLLLGIYYRHLTYAITMLESNKPK